MLRHIKCSPPTVEEELPLPGLRDTDRFLAVCGDPLPRGVEDVDDLPLLLLPAPLSVLLGRLGEIFGPAWFPPRGKFNRGNRGNGRVELVQVLGIENLQTVFPLPISRSKLVLFTR